MNDNPTTPTASSERTGLAAAGGSLVAAIASSACCWLPLLLIAFGASAGGVSAWFEQYRLHFLIGAGVLLAIGFYLVYRPAPACEPGSACAAPKTGLRRFNQVTLWIAAVLVVGFAAFPKYAGSLISAIDDPAEQRLVSNAGQILTLSIEGMTCEACAVGLKDKLEKTPGVAGASVDYSAGTANVTLSNQEPASMDDLQTAVEGAGYSIKEDE